MTDSGETGTNASKAQEMKAGFVRLLSSRIRALSDDPRQVREMVYELARAKLVEQSTTAETRELHELQKLLERAIREVERSFERSAAPQAGAAATGVPVAPKIEAPVPPPIPAPAPASLPAAKGTEAPRRPVAPAPAPDRAKRGGGFTSLVRLAVILLFTASAAAAFAYWPMLKTGISAQLAALSHRTAATPEPQPKATPPSASEAVEAPSASSKESPPSMPLPTTFGVYALNEGQLQELKPVPGKIPDRRVAISAAINTPSATVLASGDVKFIVFKPDGGIDATVTEVRVVANVSRAMGVDPTGKASMVTAGDSWVVRSMSYPYKVGPVEDQQRMLLLQPEQDGFVLSPGRYVVVVKGIGYDFTVAGAITDPNQCVERINAANGAFYSPCPPPRPAGR